MERIVRIFYGGTVSTNGEFDKMREEVLKFGNPPCFDEIVARVRAVLNVDADGSYVTVRGRLDAGRGGRAHYVVMELASENDWKLYKECLNGSQVCCAELVVDVGVGGSSMPSVQDVPGNSSQEVEPVEHLTQEIPCIVAEGAGTAILADGTVAELTRASVKEVHAGGSNKFDMAVVCNDWR
jgi:hypothetical protein